MNTAPSTNHRPSNDGIATCTALPSNVGLSMCMQIPAMEAGNTVWMQVLPEADANGKIVGEDGRWWIIQDKPKLVERLNQQARKIPVDINHGTLKDESNPAAAAATGWPLAFEARQGQGIWAQIDLNSTGAESIRNKQWRFVSPAIFYREDDRIITGLHSIGLVNHPNFTDMPALNKQANPEEPSMSIPVSILIALGLDAGASETAACQAIKNLNETVAANAIAVPDPAKYMPRGDYDQLVATNKSMKAQLDTLEGEKITALVDGYIEGDEPKITPASREHWVSMCKTQGVAAFQELMDTMPVLAVAPNKKGSKPPAAPTDGSLSAEELAACKAVGRDPKTLIAAQA